MALDPGEAGRPSARGVSMSFLIYLDRWNIEHESGECELVKSGFRVARLFIFRLGNDNNRLHLWRRALYQRSLQNTNLYALAFYCRFRAMLHQDHGSHITDKYGELGMLHFLPFSRIYTLYRIQLGTFTPKYTASYHTSKTHSFQNGWRLAC